MSMLNDNSGGSGILGGGGNVMNGLMGMENLFDLFLLYFLGELLNDDWVRVVVLVFGFMDLIVELFFN